MKKLQNTRCYIWIVLLGGVLGAEAVGFRLPNQDPDAIARGNAYVATADNPSAIYYNPAGISQLQGQNARAGLYLVSAGIDFESALGKATAKSDFKPVPEFYYVYSPESLPLSFGLGAYAPYGLSLDWGYNAPFKVHAEKGNLLYLCVNPVVAWKITETLSIAAGPTINYSSADFIQGINPMTDDRIKVDGDGMAYGFNAGLRWQPHEQWAFGVNYRYATTVDYTGSARTTLAAPYNGPTSASASIRFPQFIVAGVSYRPTTNWNFEFDVDWTDWDNVNNIPIRGTPVGNLNLVLNYRSSFMYEFGATRQLGRGYYASLGYFYSENSSPDVTFNPIIPDSDLHLGSIGIGHRGRRWDWSAAYHFGYNPGRTVSGDVAYPLANGTYHVLNHAFNIAATLKF
jgi:long-chain fatty acid transport protein